MSWGGISERVGFLISLTKLLQSGNMQNSHEYKVGTIICNFVSFLALT